jgi:Uma2 family endonuclease
VDVLDRLYTAEEFAKMEGDYELDRGRLVPVTKPHRRHGRACIRIGSLLHQHCVETGQGEVLGNDTGFLLERDPDTVRGPDIAVLRAERLVGLSDDTWPEGAPDLVVEVASPSNTPAELHRKVGQYFGSGAQLVWVVYPARKTVVIYDSAGGVQLLGEDAELTGEPVLPGFRCAIRDLF